VAGEGELTIEILDKAIAQVREYETKERTIQEVRINPNDWWKAKDAFRALGKFVGANIKVAEDSMWGIKVTEHPELPEGTMILYYDKDNFVVVKHLGRDEMAELDEAVQRAEEAHDMYVMAFDLLRRELERRGLVTCKPQSSLDSEPQQSPSSS
jgi:hypothetical protein